MKQVNPYTRLLQKLRDAWQERTPTLTISNKLLNTETAGELKFASIAQRIIAAQQLGFQCVVYYTTSNDRAPEHPAGLHFVFVKNVILNL